MDSGDLKLCFSLGAAGKENEIGTRSDSMSSFLKKKELYSSGFNVYFS
jgi:hypothetical protein